MAYVAPSTVTTLQTYSSAAHNIIVNDIIDHETRLNSYAGVYTNEAARDAAITSPTEGMRVYLTAPTIPAATTSGTTAVPSGVQTIYNGSVWVCVTEIGASVGGTPATTSTSYVTTLTGDSTAVSATLVTGTTALVSINFRCYVSAINLTALCAISVSGASTIAAADSNGVIHQMPNVTGVNFEQDNARTFILSGLTAGTNTFTLNYRTTGGTLTTTNRLMWVKGIA